MAPNFIYPYAKAWWIGVRPDYQLNWVRDKFSIVLCNDQLNPSPSLRFLSEIPTAAILCASLEMVGKGVGVGGASCVPPTFPDVPAGSRIEYLLIYHDTGNPATSELAVLQCLNPGYPVIADGKPFTIRWKNGIITP